MIQWDVKLFIGKWNRRHDRPMADSAPGAILGCTSAQARCVRPEFFAVWNAMRLPVYLDLRVWIIGAKTSYKVKECPSIFGACRGSWSGCQFDWVGAWVWYVALNCQWVFPRLFAGWLGCLRSGRHLTQPILKNGLRKVKYTVFKSNCALKDLYCG